MLSLNLNGKVNCVICKNLSRMFGNYSDQGYYLENFFPGHKVRFMSTSNPKVDSFLNPNMIEGLEAAINDRYAGKISHDIRQNSCRITMGATQDDSSFFLSFQS